jgi:hypothetical protein
MPNIFHPAMNTFSRVSIFGAVFFLAGFVALAWVIVRTPYVTEAGVIREQPIPFSHQHHVADVGLDCRYCHTSVEDSAFAGMPSTSICMNCHAYLFSDQPILEPVRESYRQQLPIHWTRVHDLADFAYFDHSIHVHHGVACITCHGQVDRMPLMWREQSLLMEWCLDCHRNPVPYLRPREFVFRTESLEELSKTAEFARYLRDSFPEIDPEQPDLDQLRRSLASQYGVVSQTNCSHCHW